MARADGVKNGKKKPIEQYDHRGKKRANNPPVGLVTPDTDPPEPAKKTYAYDPHLDPQLVWAGKAERTSFEVPTVSLHVHERIDPRTIIEAVRKRNGNGAGGHRLPVQPSLFETRAENPPLREAIDFYKHPHNWSNRLIAGDSLLVMNSLLEKEGLAGQIQMVYIDPPYGIKYGSNFQPFVNKRDVKDGKDEDLTQEPEMIRAFRDTWELGIHSYLSYLRDRLWLAKGLLNETGSCFVQINDENVHNVRGLTDEVFGKRNFIALIAVQKTTSASGERLSAVADYVVWYAREAERVRYRPLFLERIGEGWVNYDYVRLPDGKHRKMSAEERSDWSQLPSNARVYRRDNLTSQRPAQAGDVRAFTFGGREYGPGKGTFKTDLAGLERLGEAGRLEAYGETLAYRRFADDFPYRPLSNIWTDTLTGGFAEERWYVVQTITKIVQRCLLVTTDPGDLVFDPTCGSGTTAYVAEQWGRRWITCDTSRVAITLAKQRLMTALYDYYELAHPEEGVGSGFKYKTVPHVTLKSIANNPGIREGMAREQIDAAITKYAEQETLYDQPYVDKSRARVSGPFTVEAVPAPTVRSISEIPNAEILRSAQNDIGKPESEATQMRLDGTAPAQQMRLGGPAASPDGSIARSGETLRQSEWRDVLLKGGVRGKGGQMIEFSRVEPLGGARWLHADAETKGIKPDRVVISFGPEYAPLEQRQVELAWEEARQLSPKPSILLLVYTDIEPEAGKDIAELTPAKTGMTFLAAKIDADVWTKDLKKKARTSPSVWLVGQPDVELRQIKQGEDKGRWEVEVRGFDYFNTSTGTIESGDTSKIAVWLLDPDYDGRSLYPRQVFFPIADEDEGWARLAKNLKAEIEPELVQAYRGTVSLPFEVGKHKRAAVKIVDDRGIESLRVVEVK
jgi:adenine-specific DNA-methyltransferase